MSALLGRLRERDPGNDGARRALRAAIVLPLAALVGHLLGAGTQAPAFTVVGSIGLLIVADFPGNLTTRAAGYVGLGITGMLLITVGTLAAPYPWIAALLCFAVGAAISMSGLLSETFAAGQRAALMTFILPLCARPIGPVGERLLGWLVAVAICVPAALFLFPPRYNSQLRSLAAKVCMALADRIEGVRAGGESAERVTAAMAELSREFVSTAVRPVALTAGSRALIRVISNLRWLSAAVDSGTEELLGHISPLSVSVLRSSADTLIHPDDAHTAHLSQVVAAHRVIALAHYDNDIEEILTRPDDADAVELGRTLLKRRTMSATIGLTGRIIAAATAADNRPLSARLLGRDMPETGVADRVVGKRTAVASIIGYLSTRSVTVLNSLRTGAALALALGVTLILGVQNGIWVLLGALSVLRSSAQMTRTSAMRAIGGTFIGFIIGAALIAVVGTDPVVLWSLLPIVAFGATYVMVVGSFAASQAMFTMMVLIVFNMMNPIGWKVGLIRIEDVVLGAAVGLMVSVLLWPRGAAAAVQRAIDNALESGSRYLQAAVLRVTRGASDETDEQLRQLGRAALVDARTHADAVRTYLAEAGGAVETGMLDAGNRIPRVRTTADLVTDIVPPPAGTFPRARKVLEEHTAALCARLDRSDPARSVPEMSDQFIPALRAEANGPDPAIAALPLVTAAANVGALELLYPAEDPGAEVESAEYA